MEVLCPNCGYHLTSVDTSTSIREEVKTEQKVPIQPGYIRVGDDLVKTPPLPLVNTAEAEDAQGSGGGALRTVNKIHIQELHRQGLSLA
jgi:hypothetical protein